MQKGIKYPIADFEITPDVAIVDPELAETMPVKLVAHTGMDAYDACDRSLCCLQQIVFIPTLWHSRAIEMVFRSILPASYKGDMESQCIRCMMHSVWLVWHFRTRLLGIVHSMAHKTGAGPLEGRSHYPWCLRMQCICQKSSGLTVDRKQRNAMAKLLIL